jgi:hypothetical protein
MSKRLMKRMEPKPGKKSYVCKVQASVVVPGKAGLVLVPGKEYDLDGYIAEGVQLRDAVNVEWFEEVKPADVAEGNEE